MTTSLLTNTIPYGQHLQESFERQRRIEEARKMFTVLDQARIAQRAWDATKPDDDPAFTHPDHTADHRNALVAAVSTIIETGSASDPRLQAFEAKVLEIVDEYKNPKVPAGELTMAEAAAVAAQPEPELPIVEGEIVEEVAPEPPKGKLPDDFPYHSILADAGINTYTQLRNAGELTNITGIGKARAEEIQAALEAVPTEVKPTGDN